MSELNGKNRHDYSKCDEMSTEALEQILRLDFQASGDSESDIDAILYISEVIAKRKELSAEGDVDAAWERFKTKYLPYADGRSLYDFDDEDSVVSKPTEPQPNHSKKVRNHSRRHRPHHLLRLRRLLTVAVIVVACLFGGVMVAQAAGIDVLGAIGRWTENAFSFGPIQSEQIVGVTSTTGQKMHISSDSSELPTEYQELWTELKELGVDSLMFPTYIPEGFQVEESTLYIQPEFDGLDFSVWYTNRNDNIIFGILYNAEASRTYEKDQQDVELYKSMGVEYYIFSNNGGNVAAWYTDGLEYSLSTTISVSELKTILDSMYQE